MESSACLARLRAGDVAALEAVYREYFVPLRDFAARHVGSDDVADEIVEDIFVAVWERRGSLVVRTTLAAYLYGAVRRELLLHRRNRMTRLRILKGAAAAGASPGIAAPAAEPDEQFAAAELAGLLTRTIDDLPDRPREAFLLSRGHGLSHAEIAEAMDISVSTVEKHVARALNDLRAVVDAWRASG